MRGLCAGFLLALALVAKGESAAATSSGKAANVTVVQTAQNTTDRLTPKPAVPFEPTPSPAQYTLTINASETFQTMLGFGGAFTDSATYVLSKLNKTAYDFIMDAYFGPQGQQYTFGRIPMGACDFSLTPEWSYDNVKDDYDLKNFSISKDFERRIPMMKDAIARRAKSNDKIKFFGSPWSMPGWMKANGHMICGAVAIVKGCALRDEPRVYNASAHYYVRFVQEYEKQNIPIWGLTVLNEPQENLFTYEGQVFTPETERDFVKNYLGPALKANAPDVKLMYLDHNKDKLPEWSQTILGDAEAAKYLWGAAVHWYTGDHFDALASTHAAFPNFGILATEATAARDNKAAPHGGTWKDGEHYAHDMIGDFNNWVQGFVDWNLVLDSHGGPLHVGPEVSDLFGSDSMIIADTKTSEVYLQSFFYYVGHFSRFVPEGSKRIGWNLTAGSPLECTAFATPSHSEAVVVVMNPTDAAISYNLKHGSSTAALKIPAHGIQTLRFALG